MEPLISVRGSIDIWKENGGKDAMKLAREIVIKLLNKKLQKIGD